MIDDVASATPTRADRTALNNTGASDIGLFGLPPIAFAATPAAASTATNDAESGKSASAPPSSIHSIASQPFTLDVAPAAAADAPIVAAQSVPSVPLPVLTEQASATPIATGSGGVVAPIDLPTGPLAMTIAPQYSPVTADGASPVAAPPIEQAIDSVRASADQLNAALATLAQQVSTSAPSDAATAILANVETSAASLIEQADAIVNDTTATATNLIDNATDRVADVGSTANELLSAATANAASLVAATVGTATNAVDTVLAEADGLVTSSVAMLDDLAASAADLVATATSAAPVALVDDLANTMLGGVDPVGGFETLTALLQQDTSFELVDPVDETLVFAPVAAATELVGGGLDAVGDDGVVSDIADAPLLGVTDTVGGLLGGFGLQHEDDGHG